ncbi:fumarate hydratase [Fusobacterium animalis ATCC 51191]|uniref:Fumarate hydratase n=2 Tax=Fusobacterium TaxID=848 RepID=F9EN87_9FUSO|nr:fumarate hydratase [Fusobacterium animalis ATCC 51191]
MLELPTPPLLDEMKSGINIVKDLPKAPIRTFEGYRNPNGGFAGTRNILGISTTVQCVSGVLNVAVKRMKEKLLPKYPNVDDIVPINHAYGCGVAINAPDAVIPIRSLKNISKHPNFGGELMVVALGCEKLTVEMLVDEADINPENVVVLQELAGFNAMIDKLMEVAEIKLKRLNERKRETLPLSDLLIGMQCGGSDAFSGVTANPSAGYATDMLVEAGATVMFSEVTEVRDGVYILAERCVNDDVMKKLINEMKWYDNYLEKGKVDRSANPTPGNKKGGLSNIVEKAMGSIAKSGSSPIVEVLSPGEIPSKKGLIFAATPASDIVCGPSQLASGIGLQVFMTGRGTPYGLAISPVIKVSSRNNIKNLWNDLIDVNAGVIATGESTIQEVGTILFNLIIDVASGRKKSWAELYELHNDLCFFNPAPIT